MLNNTLQENLYYKKKKVNVNMTYAKQNKKERKRQRKIKKLRKKPK